MKPSTAILLAGRGQAFVVAHEYIGKVYRTLPDAEAGSHNMLRIVDEDRSEPDGYLYPASTFVPVELPEVAERALMAAGV